MKYLSTASVSRNSDPVYNSSMPRGVAILPPTERRVIAGVETGPDYSRTEPGIFGREARHFNLIARAVSASPIELSAYTAAELKGAVRLACGEDGIEEREGIPSIAQGASFRVVRSADLFFGGTINTLTPGSYVAGDTVVDRGRGRVYLELSRDDELHFAVIGLFMLGRSPSCVDWRVLDGAPS